MNFSGTSLKFRKVDVVGHPVGHGGVNRVGSTSDLVDVDDEVGCWHRLILLPCKWHICC